MINFVVALLLGTFIFFIINAFYETKRYTNLSRVEKLSAQIDEEQRLIQKKSFLERVDNLVYKFGFQGITVPLFAIFTFLYVVLASIFTLLGVQDIIGILFALPLSFIVVYFFSKVSKKREEERFRRQLLQAFGIIATQIESGDSINRAIIKTSMLIEDPLKRELQAALSKLVGSETLSSALKEISVKYPSKAIDMFLAALEIDELMGAKLAPILRQAQAVLESQFDLSAEAMAEITQAKGEFYGISAVMILVAFGMFFSSTGLSKEAYLSPLGLFILSIVFANYFAGIFRTVLIFNKAKKGSL
jgi:Flp pilus assembly protein TadB